MSWTDERIQELTTLWQQGLSASEIGRRMGVSKNAVVGKAHRLSLPSRPSPIRQQAEDVDAKTAAPAAATASQPAAGEASARPAKKTASAKSGSGRRTSSAKGTGAKANGHEQSGDSILPGNPASIRAQVEARGGRSGCLWPIGDPNDHDFHFCGASATPGKPYCSEHAARAYITRSRGERDERDDEAA